MRSRIFAAATAILLAACGDGPTAAELEPPADSADADASPTYHLTSVGGDPVPAEFSDAYLRYEILSGYTQLLSDSVYFRRYVSRTTTADSVKQDTATRTGRYRLVRDTVIEMVSGDGSVYGGGSLKGDTLTLWHHVFGDMVHVRR